MKHLRNSKGLSNEHCIVPPIVQDLASPKETALSESLSGGIALLDTVVQGTRPLLNRQFLPELWLVAATDNNFAMGAPAVATGFTKDLLLGLFWASQHTHEWFF